jgi:hypothetical protein
MTIKYDVLYNFISPVTGRILGIASLPNFSAQYNLWTGGPEVGGVYPPIEVPTINIGNLPNLNAGKVWIGNADNRPVEGDLIPGPEGPQGPEGPKGPSGGTIDIGPHISFNVGVLIPIVPTFSFNNYRFSGVAGGGAANFAGPNTIYVKGNLNMLGNRIENLIQSPQDDFDAVTAKWVWDLFNNDVIIKWQ